ncbi:ABC transporter permease [Paenibacillus koleovorans]|uniref:ABC transporter permease n=1 Tax=Paenibacillus koleovorans TaxID=121608 RepID=UPI000FDB05AD|nr:ABC transporter permease [Paenibacillus koleovorans]
MMPLLRLVGFDLRLYFRDFLTIFWTLIYPLVMLLIFGSIFGDQPGVVPGTRYIDSYVAALCAMNVISVSVFTLNINMITQRESGVLRRYRVSPIRASYVLISHSVQGLFLVLVGALEIILVASLMWDLSFSIPNLLLLLMCLLFGCLSFFCLGFALSGWASTPGAGSGLAMAVFFPSLFLSGIAFPIEIMPRFMQTISDFLPMTHFVMLIQGVWAGEPLTSFGVEWAFVGGFGIVCWVLAFLSFRWEK